ncbi:hypothetical protein NDU88_007375 [Pleurodeles waltl]|uniref:Uncharacterized protein n=1 Tax=Pleurodeles waltl TaxID=8319 RepID=A0AAV7PQ11_PLEWA|nr:hypothetical protein NDU88_007375 [Pleurodeles waltl]
MNLSNRIIDSIESKALNKGLNFVPTPKIDLFKTRTEIAELFRKVRLKTFFLEREFAEPDRNTGLRTKSNFCPTTGQMPPEVLAFEKSVSRKINGLVGTANDTFHNKSTDELTALKHLNADPSIIIKPADKGGATVILPVAMYKDECRRLLDNTQHYKRLSRDPTPEIQEEISFVVSKGIDNDWITKHEAAFLTQPNPKTPYFYILPKIHKGKIPHPGDPSCPG